MWDSYTAPDGQDRVRMAEESNEKNKLQCINKTKQSWLPFPFLPTCFSVDAVNFNIKWNFALHVASYFQIFIKSEFLS